MKSMGQIAAHAVSLIVLAGFDPRLDLSHGSPSELERLSLQNIDVIWRLILGIGVVFTSVALFLRLQLRQGTHSFDEGPAPPRDAVLQRSGAAQGIPSTHPSEHISTTSEQSETASPAPVGFWMAVPRYLSSVNTYFSENVEWKPLFGVIITSFLLDLSTQWRGSKIIVSLSLSPWPLDLGDIPHLDPPLPIHDRVVADSMRNLRRDIVATLLGSIMLLVISHYPRYLRIGRFNAALATALIFCMPGMTYLIIIILAQTLNNFGAETTAWILPANLFVTRYRTALYGIAVAAGKLGAVAVQTAGNLIVDIPLVKILPLGITSISLLFAFLVTELGLPDIPSRDNATKQRSASTGGKGSQRSEHSDSEGPVRLDTSTFIARLPSEIWLSSRSLARFLRPVPPSGHRRFEWTCVRLVSSARSGLKYSTD